MLDEQAAHQRPEDQRERTERGPPADRAGTLARIGKRVRIGIAPGISNAPASLDRAPDQQRLDAARASHTDPAVNRTTLASQTRLCP